MTGRQWTLTIPAPDKMFSANGGKPWQQTSAAKREWRAAAHTYGQKAKLPRGLGRIRVDITLSFTSPQARRDPPNYHPYVAKPIVDALGPNRLVRTKNGVRNEPGLLVVPDDGPKYVDGPYITITDELVPKRQYPLGLAVVTITDLTEETPNA